MTPKGPARHFPGPSRKDERWIPRLHIITVIHHLTTRTGRQNKHLKLSEYDLKRLLNKHRTIQSVWWLSKLLYKTATSPFHSHWSYIHKCKNMPIVENNLFTEQYHPFRYSHVLVVILLSLSADLQVALRNIQPFDSPRPCSSFGSN